MVRHKPFHVKSKDHFICEMNAIRRFARECTCISRASFRPLSTFVDENGSIHFLGPTLVRSLLWNLPRTILHSRDVPLFLRGFNMLDTKFSR